jgi:hypothetical protein
MKSSAKSLTSESVLLQRVSGNVSAFRGSDTRAGDAIIAGTGPKTFATTLYSLGYTRDGGFATHVIVDDISRSNLIRLQIQFLWHRFYVPD